MRSRTSADRRLLRGFTLLEVLVAVSILGLGLTAVLSAQTGLFASSTRTEKNSFAIGLLRCKMNEIELQMLKQGFSLVDESEQGPCCEDDRIQGFSCAWKVDRVLLPEPTEFGSLGEGSGLSDAVGATGMGPLGAIAAVGETQGGILGGNANLGGVADLLGGAAAGGAQALLPMLMSLVYPNLKPMLEASIRRVTVTVRWKEGRIDRDLSATQFVTSPQQGGLDPLAAQGLDALGGMLGGAMGAPVGDPAPSGATP
jgi:general secretion pathway protein I